jgi:DnaJ-class molecular chaperone
MGVRTKTVRSECSSCDGKGRTLERAGSCSRCNGKGWTEGWFGGENVCSTCGGSGDSHEYVRCSSCDGKGYSVSVVDVCTNCGENYYSCSCDTDDQDWSSW